MNVLFFVYAISSSEVATRCIAFSSPTQTLNLSRQRHYRHVSLGIRGGSDGWDLNMTRGGATPFDGFQRPNKKQPNNKMNVVSNPSLEIELPKEESLNEKEENVEFQDFFDSVYTEKPSCTYTEEENGVHQKHPSIETKHESSNSELIVGEKALSPIASMKAKIKNKFDQHNIRSLDAAIFFTYMTSAIAISAPIILVPVIAADPSFSLRSSSKIALSGASFTAKLASIASLGGATGKLVNGFVCQTQGARRSLSLYMTAIACFFGLFSCAQQFPQLALACTGIEFCQSIMWTACTVVFATHYSKDAKKFTQAVGLLSLASTSSALLTKICLPFLLTFMSWRNVTRIIALATLLGVSIINSSVHDSPEVKHKPQVERLSFTNISKSIKSVVRNPLFWGIGCAHATTFIVKTCDKILGSFICDVTDVPPFLCGGLTLSLTVGFALGLLNVNKFNNLECPKKEKSFLRSLYSKTVLAALSMALLANPKIGDMMGTTGLAIAIPLVSSFLASNLSFQFYTLPAKFAQNFGENKAVCLSFLDGLGFLLCAPVWSATSQIVRGSGNISRFVRPGNEWSTVWFGIAAFVGVGSTLMMRLLPHVFKWEERSQTLKQNDQIAP